MALRDFKDYYRQIQNEYFEGVENRQYMVQDFRDGKITKEVFDNFESYFNNIKLNYDRLSYTLYLLNIPNRKNKQDKYNNSNKELLQYFKDNRATKEDVLLETKDMLKELRKIVKENK